MPTPPVSCDTLAKNYWDAVAAHGENSDEANDALVAWQTNCNSGDQSGGTSRPPKAPG